MNNITMSILLIFFEIDFTKLTIGIHICRENVILWDNSTCFAFFRRVWKFLGKGGMEGMENGEWRMIGGAL